MVKGLRKLGGSKQAEYDNFGNVLYDVGSKIIPEKFLKIGLGVAVLALCGVVGVSTYKTNQAEKKELAEKQRYEVLQDSLASQELIFEEKGLEYLAQSNLDMAKELARIGENVRPNQFNNLSKLNLEILLTERGIESNQKLNDLRAEFNNFRYVVQEGDNLMGISKKYFEAVYGREPHGAYPNAWGEGASGDMPELFDIIDEVVYYGRNSGMFYSVQDTLTPGAVIKLPKRQFEKIDYNHKLAK